VLKARPTGRSVAEKPRSGVLTSGGVSRSVL
jgi:hypothetical protein